MFKFDIIIDEFPKDRELKTKRRKAARGVIFYQGKLLMVKTSMGDYKFPGGGIAKGEDGNIALKREIEEETGYTDVTVGPLLGQAFEQNIDIFDDNIMFQMDSDYYLCFLNSLETKAQKLEGYESDLEFTPVFVSVGEAYESNRSLIDNKQGMVLDCSNVKGMTVNEWAMRETTALKYLLESYVDKILPEIYVCGQMMKNADRSVLEVDDKAGHANFVTNYDKKIQGELKKKLLAVYPGALFVGEEDDSDTSDSDIESDKFAFIVDPIDGTTNFMKDYRQSCISVGLTYGGELVAGVVYKPYSEELICAEKGKGAFCNGKPIHVSNSDLDHALVSFGTAPYYEELRRKSFEKAEEFSARCIDVRRSGSAAIDLCNVAMGRVDLYFEYRICPWDIAAGAVIVTEAGGKISQTDGSAITLKDKCSILATNGITTMI